MTDKPSTVAVAAQNRVNNGTSVASGLAHPAGRLVVASETTKAGLSRQAKAGKAVRAAPNVYIVGSALAPEQAVAYHRLAIINVFWPGAVLSDRSALTGGMPFEGWIFVTHPDPARRSVRHSGGRGNRSSRRTSPISSKARSSA